MKKSFLDFLNFLAYSNIFIAICSIFQCLVTFKIIGSPVSIALTALVFFATLHIYNLSILSGSQYFSQNLKTIREEWLYSHRKLNISLIIISFLFLLPLSFFISTKSKLLLIFLALCSIGYGHPLIKGTRLRDIPYLKLFMISLIWSISCVILPIWEAESRHLVNLSSWEIIVLTLKRFLLIAAITIPFDIKDRESDSLDNLKTLPVVWGDYYSKLFSFTLLIVYLIIQLFTQNETNNLIFYGLITNLLLSFYLVNKADTKSDLFFYFCLDGILILQYFLIIVI